jgi:hypothetical protein
MQQGEVERIHHLGAVQRQQNHAIFFLYQKNVMRQFSS